MSLDPLDITGVLADMIDDVKNPLPLWRRQDMESLKEDNVDIENLVDRTTKPVK